VNDHDALLAAIIADPNDDLPRLAMADWLDENGQPHRAEFIRLQLELAPLSEDDAQWRELDARAGELLRKHGKKWAASLAACGLGRLEYRRGFAEEALIEKEGLFVDNHARVTALAPLRDICFDWDFDPREQEDESPGLLRLLDSPALALITKLDMGDADGMSLLESLFSCPDYFFIGTESRPGDSARGEQLWRLHFGDEAYSRLTAHFGRRILCDQAEWHP
jgi:uncharacterized protein (TIGR02996 family)